MANRDPKKRPQDDPKPAGPPRTANPSQPPAPAAPPSVKKEDISRWEGEGGAPPKGSQGRSKDGDGTGKKRPPREA